MDEKAGDQYLLMDGTYADPADCSRGNDGVLRHANGVPVALKADGSPMTLEQHAHDDKNVEAVEMGKEPDDRPADAAPMAKQNMAELVDAERAPDMQPRVVEHVEPAPAEASANPAPAEPAGNTGEPKAE